MEQGADSQDMQAGIEFGQVPNKGGRVIKADRFFSRTVTFVSL
jgi:hypothetical protein